MPYGTINDNQHVSLCEVLDRVLAKGAVVEGQITISVADIDLIQLALNLVIASAGTLDGPSFKLENGREVVH